MKQNQILDLPVISNTFYENIFNVYTTKVDNNLYYFYNIGKKLKLPTLDNDAYTYYRITEVLPWTLISYRIYKSINLWWLIILVNDIQNPVKMLEAGSIIKIIKPTYVSDILSNLSNE